MENSEKSESVCGECQHSEFMHYDGAPVHFEGKVAGLPRPERTYGGRCHDKNDEGEPCDCKHFVPEDEPPE